MKATLVLVLWLLSWSLAKAGEEAMAFAPDGFVPVRQGTPSALSISYCQPAGWTGINASSGYGSEIADDIPASLTGQSFNTVTLYMGQWLATWIDPQGLAIDIMYEQCAPSVVADLHFEFLWSELSPVFVGQSGSLTYYEVTAVLPTPLTITTNMSLGAYVLNDWGNGAPFCGFSATQRDDIFGCDEAYWEAPSDGAVRWTSLSAASGFYGDLAYCLSLNLTSAVGTDFAAKGFQLQPGHPNPFNPSTTLRFELADPSRVRLEIFSISGRKIRTLAHEELAAGSYERRWNGLTDHGRPVASGTYFGRLTTTRGSDLVKLTLLK